mgnify:CR=1 FL=1
MANLNYANPESLYPLNLTSPGQAFGSGSVPGSVLAGMLLPERLQDYRNVRDASLQSSLLGNKRTGAELNDYLAAGPAREMEYSRQFGASKNALALQPDQHKLATMNLQSDIATAKPANELKMAQALAALPAQQASAHLSQLMTASAILKGLRKETDGPQTLQLLNKYGIDTKDWDPSYLDQIRNMDPQSLKEAFEREQTMFKETQHTGRTLEEIEGRERVAEISAGRKSAAGARVERDNRMDEEVLNDFVQIGLEKGLSRTDAERAARIAVWQTRARDPYGQQGAAGQREIDVLERIFKVLKKEPTTPVPTEPPVARQGTKQNLMTIPEVGEVEVIMKNPDGSIKFKDPKSGRTGTYKP